MERERAGRAARNLGSSTSFRFGSRSKSALRGSFSIVHPVIIHHVDCQPVTNAVRAQYRRQGQDQRIACTAVRAVLELRPHPRHPRDQRHQDARSGLPRICRPSRRDYGHAGVRGYSILRQATRESPHEPACAGFGAIPLSCLQHIEYARSPSHATIRLQNPNFVSPALAKAKGASAAAVAAASASGSKGKNTGPPPKRPRDDDEQDAERESKREKTDQAGNDDDDEMEIEEDEDAPKAAAAGAAAGTFLFLLSARGRCID